MIDSYIKRAYQAQNEILPLSQDRIDGIVTELGWAIYNLENATRLAEIAVKDIGLGVLVIE